jgi:hypothetical protein
MSNQTHTCLSRRREDMYNTGFEALTAVIMKSNIFSAVTSFNSVGVLPKCRWTCPQLHGVTTQEIIFFKIHRSKHSRNLICFLNGTLCHTILYVSERSYIRLSCLSLFFQKAHRRRRSLAANLDVNYCLDTAECKNVWDYRDMFDMSRKLYPMIVSVRAETLVDVGLSIHSFRVSWCVQFDCCCWLWSVAVCDEMYNCVVLDNIDFGEC